MKRILGKVWRIKSVQSFGYIIEDVNNPNDIRRISFNGWDEAEDEKT